jgi:diaminohydroxyphosphoribosylaminopyrimidine deaminase / 5-amino-6-(5-phosphoribosylamino)uracil reductase
MSDSSPSNNSDAHWMALALAEARKGVGLTSPNPPVGAVIVRGGEILGRGFHKKAGGPHAEVEALRDAAQAGHNDLRQATIYVTLEPCSTHGRTPPCTDAITTAGLARVVYGASDPNPKHQDGAHLLLTSRGMEVTTGVLEDECKELIAPFSKWITTGTPYVIAKAGQSLDGRITRPEGESQWITSEEARLHARRLRSEVDAILVGAETVRKDNPKLTLRDGQMQPEKPQPWRVVMTRTGNLPQEAHVFTDAHKDRTLVMKGLELRDVLQALGDRGVTSVLIEGGGEILGQAFRERLVDEVVWYVAPRLCGSGRPALGDEGLSASVPLQDVRLEIIGDNVCYRGRPVWQP